MLKSWACALPLPQELTPSDAPIGYELVSSALAFMQTLGLDCPNVLGWSLGAATMLELLQEHPEAIG